MQSGNLTSLDSRYFVTTANASFTSLVRDSVVPQQIKALLPRAPLSINELFSGTTLELLCDADSKSESDGRYYTKTDAAYAPLAVQAEQQANTSVIGALDSRITALESSGGVPADISCTSLTASSFVSTFNFTATGNTTGVDALFTQDVQTPKFSLSRLALKGAAKCSIRIVLVPTSRSQVISPGQACALARFSPPPVVSAASCASTASMADCRDSGLRGVQPQVAQCQGRGEARLLDVRQQTAQAAALRRRCAPLLRLVCGRAARERGIVWHCWRCCVAVGPLFCWRARTEGIRKHASLCVCSCMYINKT